MDIVINFENWVEFLEQRDLIMEAQTDDLVELARILGRDPQEYFRGGSFQRSDFSHKANLNGIDLQGSDLRAANFSHSVLTDVNFEKADLRGANLDGVSLTRVNFKGALLDGISIENATGDEETKSSFMNEAVHSKYYENQQQAHLQEADFSCSTLSLLGLRESKLQSANFRRSTLIAVDLAEADLRNADFAGATLCDVNLQGAILDGASWQGSFLDRRTLLSLHPSITSREELVNLLSSQVMLKTRNLQGVDLQKIDLSNSGLHQLNLQNADLQGADFSNSILDNVNLSGANLQGVNLIDVNLKDVTLVGVSWQGAQINQSTLNSAGMNLPEGDILFGYPPNISIPACHHVSTNADDENTIPYVAYGQGQQLRQN
ncbi:MAG: pentapeptide repeat-containing protein [Leptolyngbyaceae cyanobacterium CRU_2_3]|nr:pentapeptide repeat-containing protein [Leptolyngbyaceae cyanobacterium CRU_2_3]